MKIVYPCFSKRKNQRSQIAVIITLIIAALFLLTMIFINIYKVSTIKTSTSQTADKTALRIASKIGSISKVYLDALKSLELWPLFFVTEVPANKTAYIQFCNFNLQWWSLPLLAVVAIAGALLFWMIPYVSVILTGLGLFVSMSMTSGITQKLQDMSAYNSIREEALFKAMEGLQSDSVELKNLRGAEEGVFQDPNPDPSDPVTQIKYDLSTVPGMKKVFKVPRFYAWYYTKRYPLVDERVLKDAVDVFINGKDADKRDGLKKFVYIDPADWDSTNWKIKKLSYSLGGRRAPDHTVAEPGLFTVTCDSCPGWVVDSATDKIKLINLDAADDFDMSGALDAIGVSGKSPLTGIPSGLLWDLQLDYLLELRPIFCDLLCPLPAVPIVRDGDWDCVREDMRLLLKRTKEVLNLPNAERLRGLTQWFTPFYDPSAHNADHSPKVAGDTESDIHLRLTRDMAKIEAWIIALNSFNDNIMKPRIFDHYGSYCNQGRGDAQGNCYMGIDPCYCYTIGYDDSGDPYTICEGAGCINSQTALWYGNYGTCAGNDPYNSHPVCNNGDFYGAIPDWCFVYRSVPCATNTDPCLPCSPPAQNFNAIIKEYDHQGQFSWRPYVEGQYDWNLGPPAGPTEVKQAIDILDEWLDDLRRIQVIIETLQDKIAVVQAQYTVRNNIVYAWKDKPSSITNMPQYSHIARVTITDYPLYLPYITEKTDFAISWLLACKTRTLHDYYGTFEITASRYDQDQPNLIWNLRRRKSPLTAEYNIGNVNSMVSDIQTSGRIMTGALELMLIDILDNYAITSKAKAQYGPKREDIAIISVDGGSSVPE